MKQPLRIVVAEDQARLRKYFQRILPILGHEVVAVAEDGLKLVHICNELQPDLVIADIKMPEMDGIDAARVIYEKQPIPIILISAYYDEELIERAENEQIMAYLVKPIKQADLAPAIAVAMSRYEHFQTLRKEATDLRQALDDRKIIERAKGILMKMGSLDEQEAFRRLQKLARDKNRRLVEVAQMVVGTQEALDFS